MEWDRADGTIYFDNFEFYEADVDLIDPNSLFELKYNASKTAVTLPLARLLRAMVPLSVVAPVTKPLAQVP